MLETIWAMSLEMVIAPEWKQIGSAAPNYPCRMVQPDLGQGSSGSEEQKKTLQIEM